METLDEVLAHHGIKGMRWGVRRAKGPGGTVGSSPDAKRAMTTHEIVKTHGTQAVSSHDLQHLVNRMNLEQRYETLSAPQKSTGAKLAGEVLQQFGKQEAGKALSKGAHILVKKALTKE